MASDSDADEKDTLYCICREPYDGERFMIECDVCKDWFHGSCVGVKESQAADIENYHCPNCQVKHGPLVLRKKRQTQRQDYSEDTAMAKAFQTGSLKFVQVLKSRKFPSADEVILKLRDGLVLSLNHLEENGFTVPILVDDKYGLGLKVPPPHFSIQDVEDNVGSMREIDVIDVAKQGDYRMLMREWTEYYNSTNRDKVLNVISLEFTKTKLAEMVEPPQIVRQMSWTTNLWPKGATESSDDQSTHERPCVQRYCLMGVKDSYTDFHIDFGGTSVWYHVLRGEKVFYLIEPTTANLGLYEAWISSSNQSGLFFGDQVQKCYKCVVSQGQTLFIPTGWIHAVLTPVDSLVFGGNFLHSFNIEMQIQIYELEKRVKTPERYMFPNYETLHWYAAKHIYQEIAEFLDNEEPPPLHLVSGGKFLVTALKSWTHKRDYIKRDAIPESIQYGKLLKDLQKQLRQISVVSKPNPLKPLVSQLPPMGPVKRKWKEETETEDPSDSKEIKVDDTDDSGKEDNVVVKHEPVDTKSAITSVLFTKPSVAPVVTTPKQEVKSEVTSLDPSSHTVTATATSPHTTKLTFRLPKPGAYIGPRGTDSSVFDFKGDERKSGVKDTAGGDGHESNASSQSTKKLKLVIPADRRQSGDGGETVKVESTSTDSSQDSDHDDSHNDSDPDDQLVVDETPKRKNASLKLKLSVSKREESSVDASQEAEDTDSALSPSDATHLDKVLPDHTYTATLPAKKLKLPSYTHFPFVPKTQNIVEQKNSPDSATSSDQQPPLSSEASLRLEDIKASPSMRDAIQGMLSMSQMAPVSTTLQTSTGSSPFLLDRDKAKATLRLERESKVKKYQMEDGNEGRLSTAFKDDQYVYPCLEGSDQEDGPIFKPRGKQKRDETWNPKAKIVPGMPSMERPGRPSAKKESVESQLEDAAAKLSHKPLPKRQYVRKKPKVEKPCLDSVPSTSRGYMGFASTSSDAVDIFGGRLAISQPSSSSKPAEKQGSVKKGKKGMATAKQRLGKILKLNRMAPY